jgi:hypothetical protein
LRLIQSPKKLDAVAIAPDFMTKLEGGVAQGEQLNTEGGHHVQHGDPEGDQDLARQTSDFSGQLLR